jgi:hypothetical protein
MKQRDGADLRHFEEKCENPEMSIPFQKPSPGKAFPSMNDFAEGRKMGLSEERLVKDESREANKTAALAMQSRLGVELATAAGLEVNANVTKGTATRVAGREPMKSSHLTLPVTPRPPSGILTN